MRALRLAVLGSCVFGGPLRAQGPQAECGTATAVTVRRGSPLDRTVTLHAHGIQLRDALGRLAAAARFRLSYSPDLLPLDRRVCLAHDARPAGEALASLLQGIAVEPRIIALDHVALAPVAHAESVAVVRPRTAPVLESVVVTGSTIGAARRALPVALSVLQGPQLTGESNDGSLASVLQGSVPGVWAWEQSPASALMRYGSIRGASSFGASYPKVYIDGVEVANPLVLSYVEPDMIERVEVIRGPQGAALYGTDAISGVINVVTRLDGGGRTGGWAMARSQAGTAQSDFARSTLSQLNSLAIRAGSSARSLALGATFGSMGAYVPDAFSRQTSITGGSRIVGSKGIVTSTARFFAQNAETPVSPVLADSTLGALDSAAIARQLVERARSVRQYTLGVTGKLAASETRTVAATIGLDGYRLSGVEDDFIPIPTIADVGLREGNSSGQRATLRVSTVSQRQSSPTTHVGVTLAAEHSMLWERADEPAIVAWQPGEPTRPARSDIATSWSNTGVIAQTSFAWKDALYLSAGGRAERNGGFATSEVSFLPMLGAAWVREYPGATLKLRAAYGKGIRPQKTVTRESTWVGGLHSPRHALEPEEQSGIEAGIDLFLGRAVALQVTRFDQLASGLIQRVTLGADTSMRSRRGPRAIGYAMQNVGEISNSGWEIEAGARAGAVSLNGTLSFVESRVRRTAVGYTGDLRPGDRMLEVPARTATLTARYANAGWTVTAAGSRATDWINYDRLGLAWAVVNGLHPEAQYIGDWLRGFWDTYEGVNRLRASVSRDVTRTLTLTLSGENLLGEQLGEPDNITVLPGRTISLGVRLNR